MQVLKIKEHEVYISFSEIGILKTDTFNINVSAYDI